MSDKPSGNSVFEKAIQAWNKIGLSALQKELDEQGVQILEHQKESLVGRKELATSTKAFKKLSDEEKLTGIKGLLKAYQTEIDNLTKRGKYAETSFLSVYRLFAEAPDPIPLLEASVDSVGAASDAKKLAAENVKLQEKLSKYADYDVLKAKLSKLETDQTTTIANKVAAKEAELRAVLDEQQRNWNTQKKDLEKQVEEAREQLKETKVNYEVAKAQLSVADHSDDREASQAAASKIAELEMTMSDLQRANRKVADLEERNLQLRTELETSKSEGKLEEIRKEFEDQLTSLESENAVLAAKISSQRATYDSRQNKKDKKLEMMERDLYRRRAEVEDLREQLQAQSDYQEIKRELGIFKSIEFDDGADDEDGHSSSSVAPSSLEKQLLARNKKLSSDAALSRVAIQELEGAITHYKENEARLESELERTKKLNQNLEEDLMKLQNTAGSDAYSVISGWPKRGTPTAVPGRSASPTTSILGGHSGRESGSMSGSSVDSDILKIVSQQRERLRERVVELEEEQKRNCTLITNLRRTVDEMKRENMELYERSRYQSNFGANTKSTSARSIIEEKYKNEYEEAISPFALFKGKESERVMSKLGPLERIALSFSRFVLSNRLTRNVFVLYCAGLHVLLVVILVNEAASPSTSSIKATGQALRPGN